MSWGEIKKAVNSNLDLPLNEYIHRLLEVERYIFTQSGTFTPRWTGKYRIIAIGAGGNGGNGASEEYGDISGGGGAGGVGVLETELMAGTAYDMTITTSASFAGLITATPGANGPAQYSGGTGKGGTASGTGVIVYPGNDHDGLNGGNVTYPKELSTGGSGSGKGGMGIFGGNGGDGGRGGSSSQSATSGATGGLGAGSGGNGGAGQSGVGNVSSSGGGGGGGFGGGGGGGADNPYVNGGQGGKGGSAAIIIFYLG